MRTAGDSEEVQALAVKLAATIRRIISLNRRGGLLLNKLSVSQKDCSQAVFQEVVNDIAKEINQNMSELGEVAARLTAYARFLESLERGPGGGSSEVKAKASSAFAGGVPRSLSSTQQQFKQFPDGSREYNSPMETDASLYKSQGSANPKIRGTCGLCSIVNVLRLAGIQISEKEVIDYAMSMNLCLFCTGDSAASGGTCAEDRKCILEHFGVPSHIEPVPIGDAGATDFTLGVIASQVNSGHGVIISVDAGELYEDGRYMGAGHAITVTSVRLDSSGSITGYYICDSNIGKGTRLLEKEHMRRCLSGAPINITDTVIR